MGMCALLLTTTTRTAIVLMVVSVMRVIAQDVVDYKLHLGPDPIAIFEPIRQRCVNAQIKSQSTLLSSKLTRFRETTNHFGQSNRVQATHNVRNSGGIPAEYSTFLLNFFKI